MRERVARVCQSVGQIRHRFSDLRNRGANLGHNCFSTLEEALVTDVPKCPVHDSEHQISIYPFLLRLVGSGLGGRFPNTLERGFACTRKPGLLFGGS